MAERVKDNGSAKATSKDSRFAYKRILEEVCARYTDKIRDTHQIAELIPGGANIYLGSGWAVPQSLLNGLITYAATRTDVHPPRRHFTFWVAVPFPCTLDSLPEAVGFNLLGCIGFVPGQRSSLNINSIPASPGEIPLLIRSGTIPVDAVILHTSPPDRSGNLSLGISSHSMKASLEQSPVVIAQINPAIPRVHGDGFIPIDRVDFILPRYEPLPISTDEENDCIAKLIGTRLSAFIMDGDTLQVGYGALPSSVLKYLSGKKNLGIHSEILTDGMINLIKTGAVDNSRKSLNRHKTIASVCIGTEPGYGYIDENPSVELRSIDYTNDPRLIGRHSGMVAINTVGEIDLTGQACIEGVNDEHKRSLPFSPEFLRGISLSHNGKSFLVLRSTDKEENRSTIIPFLREGAGAAVNRGDVQYVITEYGAAYLHGRNVRERAMELIGIAHPKFRPWLMEEAKRRGLIYRDQIFIPSAIYPDYLERRRTTKTGVQLLLRPVKISDEPLLKSFFYSLSDQTLYRRFMANVNAFHHELLQQFSTIDYSREMMILALDIQMHPYREKVLGTGQYVSQKGSTYAEVAFAVRDDCQNAGIGYELVSHLVYCARRFGLKSFKASVFSENKAMISVFEKMGFDAVTEFVYGTYEITMTF